MRASARSLVNMADSDGDGFEDATQVQINHTDHDGFADLQVDFAEEISVPLQTKWTFWVDKWAMFRRLGRTWPFSDFIYYDSTRGSVES